MAAVRMVEQCGRAGALSSVFGILRHCHLLHSETNTCQKSEYADVWRYLIADYAVCSLKAVLRGCKVTLGC